MRSVRALVAGLVDYAGLFPPAQLGMGAAMSSYAEYLSGPHAWMLGRFVIPVSRLAEFDDTSGDLLPRGEGSPPWRLAALVGDDFKADVQEALKFNCRHWQGSEIGHAIIDTMEMRARADVDPAGIRAAVPDFFTLYVETGRGEPADLLRALHGAGARAKIRMGGVTADAFPSGSDAIGYMAACVELGLPFKATAGLHHLIRSDYPLTYEPGSSRAAMYGYLNVFLSAIALFSGASKEAALGILMESDVNAFRFDDAGVTWRELTITTDEIIRGRALATSYGSCSFREPVDELLAVGLAQ